MAEIKNTEWQMEGCDVSRNEMVLRVFEVIMQNKLPPETAMKKATDLVDEMLLADPEDDSDESPEHDNANNER